MGGRGRLLAMAVDIDLGMRGKSSGLLSGLLCNWVRDGQPGVDEWESWMELVREEAA